MPNTLQAISIGAMIPAGNYGKVFSSHTKAVNFIYKNQVITICSRHICAGPFRIVLSESDVSALDSFSLQHGILQIAGQVCNTSTANIYQINCLQPVLDAQMRRIRIKKCFLHYVNKVPPFGVGALLRAEEGNLKGFELALAKSYKQGQKLFSEENYSEGIKCFKGKGYGLTPGGDDFLAGYILGLAYRQTMGKKDLSEILAVLLYESLSENYLSNTFLIQAAQLLPNRDWLDFFEALESNTKDPLPFMQQISALGASSGYDTLSGFFAAWEMI